MKPIKLTIDADVLEALDAQIARGGPQNRAGALRALLAQRSAGCGERADASGECAGSLTYVYDQRETSLAVRLRQWRGEHHTLTITTTQSQLGWGQCLETVVLRGDAAALRGFAQAVMALPGVRFSNLHLLPLSTLSGPAAGQELRSSSSLLQ